MSTIELQDGLSLVYGTDHLRRANDSNIRNAGDCQSSRAWFGVGEWFQVGSTSRCLPPCPASYVSIAGTNECEPRALISEVTQYYEILADARATCDEKQAAYDRAVAAGGDVDAPPVCENPYEDAEPPYIPPPPTPPQVDESGGSGQPRSRVFITAEDISTMPMVDVYGFDSEPSDLAIKLRNRPTYADVYPAVLNQLCNEIAGFTWRCDITQDEFDNLSDEWKCRLCTEYTRTIYDMPENIAILRQWSPTITITRSAPDMNPPHYTGCPSDERAAACIAQGGEYAGGCFGTCTYPEVPEAPDAPIPDAPSSVDGTTIALVAGGIVLVGGGLWWATRSKQPAYAPIIFRTG
jgi:hypothetical protein